MGNTICLVHLPIPLLCAWCLTYMSSTVRRLSCFLPHLHFPQDSCSVCTATTEQRRRLGSGHSSHRGGTWGRTWMEREQTVNGHLEGGAKMFLRRGSGLEISQRGSALQAPCSFCFFIFSVCALSRCLCWSNNRKILTDCEHTSQGGSRIWTKMFSL